MRLPDGPLYLVFCAYALTVPPALSMILLPNGPLDALLSSIKAWPVTDYFSFAALLLLLRPSEAALRRAALLFGAGTFAVMLLLWVAVPASWYQPGAEGANMFSWDSGRGAYIRMPMMLGVVWLLWLAHRFVREWRLDLWVGARRPRTTAAIRRDAGTQDMEWFRVGRFGSNAPRRLEDPAMHEGMPARGRGLFPRICMPSKHPPSVHASPREKS